MASDKLGQVALTRSHRIPAQSSSGHISKAARQIVPAFLQKLYEMVNYPKNAELICWSETGDSFFVLDHERFAHDVLGKWFKHRNFSSFVRQLNMYGFHKVLHLQQNVLKSDAENEFWNFAHPNFLRGKPDLLCFIQRKKHTGAGQQHGDEGMDLTAVNVPLIENDPGTSGSVPSSTTKPTATNLSSSGQVLDINSILNGIAAIKRHQTTISEELNELKRANQLLWQESLTVRAKHQKQQDTINKIVKFLAGVFGQAAGSVGVGSASPSISGQHLKEDGAADDGLAMTMAPGIRKRLMIEDSKKDGLIKNMASVLTEMPMPFDEDNPIVETPGSAASPTPSLAQSDVTVSDAASYHANSNTLNTASETTTVNNLLEAQTEQGTQISRAVTPTRHSSTLEVDPRIHSLFSQLTPTQIQQLLVNLASQTIANPDAPATTINPDATTNFPNTNPSPTMGTLTPYNPASFDFSINPASPNPFSLSPNTNNMLDLIQPDDLISFDNYDMDNPPVLPHGQSEKMQNQWRAVEDIDKSVCEVNNQFNSFMQNIGLESLDLGMFAEQPSDAAAAAGTGIGPVPNSAADAVQQSQNQMPGRDPLISMGDGTGGTDFFATFFNNFAAKADELDVTNSTNEFEYPDQTSSVSGKNDSSATSVEEIQPKTTAMNTRGKKRKSEASEDSGNVNGSTSQTQNQSTKATGTGSKSKRRR